MTYSTFSGYSPAMDNHSSLTFTYAQAASPHLSYSNVSEYSTPSPSSTYGSPSPIAPEAVLPVPRSHNSTSRIKMTENLTPKQLKRRLQNRVSQQAVRRRRNSPARILETHLQELDKQHGDLMSFYSSNIESCIQTLTAEIQTLRELQQALAAGTSGVPDGFEATLGGQVMFSSIGSRSDARTCDVGLIGSHVVGTGTGDMGMGIHAVDQSATYQNHDFNSNVTGAHC